MRRSLLVVCTCLLLVSGLVVAAPVAPYGDPAPGLNPRSWACYQTCVLPTDILAADTNADGWTDLAILCSATGQVHFLDNLAIAGPGVFSAPGAYVPGSGPVRFDNGSQIEPADNGLYVLYENVGAPTLGTASPTAGAQMNISPVPANTVGFVSADFDHDLALDLVLLLSNGIVDAAGTVYPVAAPPVAAMQGDFNQDAWLDIAILLGDGSIVVLYNNRFGGGGTFTAGAATTGLSIVSPTDIGAGDFNGDGRLDFVVVGSNPPDRGFGLQDGYAQVFLNTLATTGAVGFAPTGNPMRTWGFNAAAVEVLDADGNGFDDFAVANWGSATVTIFLTVLDELAPDNRAAVRDFCVPDQQLVKITFVLYKYELQCGHFPIALAAADYDLNGKMDLAIALQSTDEELCAQNPSCIEVIFDLACGFHSEGRGAPRQLEHWEIENVTGENVDCPAPCKTDDCDENDPPEAEIDPEEGESGE